MVTTKDESSKTILEIVDGTKESEARDNLGIARREMTGVLAQSTRVKFLKISSKIMKPISVINSAIGLTISILLLTEDVFWSNTFWISLFIGLIIGVFFELWATNSEHAFANSEDLEIDNNDKAVYRIILFSIKSYALVMVLISAWNLPDYIIIQKTKSVEDNDYIKSRLSQIERLKRDKEKASNLSATTSIYKAKIERLKGEIEKIRAEKTDELVKNSTSKFQAKRNDALEVLASITARIEAKNREIAEAEQKMITAGGKTQKQLYEDEISKKEDEIVAERERLKTRAKSKKKSTLGISIMLGVLFVLLELGGTFASILAQRTVLKSISPEEAYKDSVTNKLFSSSIALKERNTRLKATKIVADIQQNKTMTEVIRYESEAMAQNHRLQEEARLAEIDRENAKLLTEAKLQELEANQLLMMTKGIAKKMEGLDTVRVQIGRILEKGGKNV